MTTMNELMSSGKKLDGVKAYYDPDLENDCVLLVLIFGRNLLSIKVLEDDSLKFDVSTTCKCNGLIEQELDFTFPWIKCIGKPMRWFWVMENNQGYLDGVQFEFATNVSDEANIVQLVGIASRLDIRVVTVC